MKKFLTFDGQDCVMSSVQQCSCPSIQCPQAIDTHLVLQRFESGFDRAKSGLTRHIPHLETTQEYRRLNDLILKGCQR